MSAHLSLYPLDQLFSLSLCVCLSVSVLLHTHPHRAHRRCSGLVSLVSTENSLLIERACSSAVACPACSSVAPPDLNTLSLAAEFYSTSPFLSLFIWLLPDETRRRGGKARHSGHAERGRGGEADDGGTGERDEGAFDQRHLLPARRRPAAETARRHPGGLALQVPDQEEEEVQAAVVPEKEQKAEGESGDLRGFRPPPPPSSPDLGEILLVKHFLAYDRVADNLSVVFKHSRDVVH